MDWAQVPFEVGCARCGRDLRGLREARCPGCGLEFDWADAVPIDELLCEGCGYRLFGLSETRCPECGVGFTWEGVLEARQRRKQPLFEYHWRRRLVRSYVASLMRATRPRRLWSLVDIHDRAPTRALFWLAAVTVVVLVVMAQLGLATAFSIVAAPGRVAPSGRWVPGVPRLTDFGAALVNGEVLRTGGILMLTTVCWWGLSLGALLIFGQSMRLFKVRTGHVVRVWCYSVVLPLLGLCAAELAWMAGWTALELWGDWPSYVGGVEIVPVGVTVILLVFWGFVMWSLGVGYRGYLRMDHAMGVAFCSQLIAVLALLTVMLNFALL